MAWVLLKQTRCFLSFASDSKQLALPFLSAAIPYFSCVAVLINPGMISGTSDREGHTPSKIKLYPYQASLHSPRKEPSQEATLGKCSKLCILNLELLSQKKKKKKLKRKERQRQDQEKPGKFYDHLQGLHVSVSSFTPCIWTAELVHSRTTKITFKGYGGRDSESNGSTIFIKRNSSIYSNKSYKHLYKPKRTSQVEWYIPAIP